MYKGQPAHARAEYHQEHDPDQEAMLSRTSVIPNSQQFSDINVNASSNAIYTINASVYPVIELSDNGSTPRAAPQSNEFYQSYDPSIGLHTAAVLGGILVWLVLYVIYRTKIRKWAIAAIKKKFGSLETVTKPPCSAEADLISNSGRIYQTAAKPLINPSIVIETSPPQSPTKSPSTYDQLTKVGVQECLSPFSLPGGNLKDDMMIFRFPGQHQPLGRNDRNDPFFQQLPISEMDIPTATAQWVQNMPLAARSYQEFAGLMLNMQARKFLPDDKPGSCPLVYVTPPPSLPVLELSAAWNNSLPVLTSSVSDHLLNSYESVNYRKELKDLINAKRKLSAALKKNDDSPEENMINEIDCNRFSQEMDDKFNKNLQNQQNEKRKGKRSPGLTIDIPDVKDTLTLINNTSISHSPVPLPVTPTVMIQNSTKTPSRRRVCNDSNTSLSSSSSDLLPGPINTLSHHNPTLPPIHITGPLHEGSFCHPSVPCPDDQQMGRYYGGCYDNPQHINAPSPCRGLPGGCMHNINPLYHQCSFRHSRSDDFTNSGMKPKVQRHGSLKESYLARQNCVDSPHRHNPPVFQHRRSMSVYNNKPSTNPNPHPGFHQRSLSADMSSYSACNRNLNRSNELGSTYSLGIKSPSPNFLRVPDANNSPMDRSFFHDVNTKNNYSKIDNDASNTQSVIHGSDRNISYYGSPYRPISPLVDTPHNIIRRHSSNYTLSGRSQLVHCSDNTSARPSSSSSYFYPVRYQESLSSSCLSPLSQNQDQQQQQYNLHERQSYIHHQQQQQSQTPQFQHPQTPPQQRPQYHHHHQQQQLQQHIPIHNNCESASNDALHESPANMAGSDDSAITKSSPSVVMETKL